MAKYLFEFKQLIKIGVPIFGSQLSYTLMGATDTIIAGRASANDLAGLAVGTAFSNTIWFFFTGIIFAVTPIVAQLYGAKKFLEIGQKLREIIWVAAGLGLLMAFIFYNMDIIIGLLPIKNSITSVTIGYLKAVSIGWFFVTIFTCLRCYSEGMTFTKPVFYIAFSGMLLNIPLDLIFVYGWFGAPKLGGIGCGIATSIVSFIMMISIFVYINYSKNYKKTMPFSRFSLPSLKTTKEVFKLGLPIGLGIFIELSMFSGAAIILSVLGEIVVASHSVAISIASLFFMVPLAIGLASSTRVGNLIGEKNPYQAKIAATSTILLCISGALINSIIIISFGSFIVGLYTTEVPVLELAISLILFAAIFQLPDGIQMGALGSLRGYKDTFIPMILLMISYWIFAMPIGYYLTNFGFGTPLGAKGMWFGMIIGLSIFSFLSIFRLKWVVKDQIKKISTNNFSHFTAN
tara:strand:+ start:88 stop:1470 length:1383 start_codon:yes stop_codon:yes gene_type:complete